MANDIFNLTPVKKSIKVDGDIHYTLKKMCLDMPGTTIGDEASKLLRESFKNQGVIIESIPAK